MKMPTGNGHHNPGENGGEAIYQRSWHSHVRRWEARLLVEVYYLDEDREYCARMEAHPISFEVLSASFEIYRHPEEAFGRSIALPQLAGLEAYLGCGPQLRRAVEFLKHEFVGELFAEGVRGIVQAETFLWRERGFSSPSEYGQHFAKLFDGSCRYYSFLERVTRNWDEYAGSYRQGLLFSRAKEQILYSTENKLYLLGSLNDSFHGALLELELAEGGMVTRAQGFLPRIPDEVCREAAAFAKALEGRQIAGMEKREIASLMGEGKGCVHLIDLAADGVQTLELAEKKQA